MIIKYNIANYTPIHWKQATGATRILKQGRKLGKIEGQRKGVEIREEKGSTEGEKKRNIEIATERI